MVKSFKFLSFYFDALNIPESKASLYYLELLNSNLFSYFMIFIMPHNARTAGDVDIVWLCFIMEDKKFLLLMLSFKLLKNWKYYKKVTKYLRTITYLGGMRIITWGNRSIQGPHIDHVFIKPKALIHWFSPGPLSLFFFRVGCPPPVL
jgi:hypothetical protein